MPTAAARQLVRGLVAGGVHVAVSADDDKGGLTVKAVLAAEGAEPLAPQTRWEEASVESLRSSLGLVRPAPGSELSQSTGLREDGYKERTVRILSLASPT